MSNLTTIQPEWSVPPNVRVVSTTRHGGVSKAPYDSMNLGLHVQDDEQDVRTNRQLLASSLQLPMEPVWLNQVHGTHVAAVSDDADSVRGATADGAYTSSSHCVLAVMTADCLPVVFSDVGGTAVAVAHAGWRGLAAGVLQSALSQFNADAQVHAWLGPAIGPAAFEVGDEVRAEFLARDENNVTAFTPAGAGKHLADLYALARIDLNRQRKVTVTGGDHCTYSDACRFHSYRRNGAASGRMVTLAWID